MSRSLFFIGFMGSGKSTVGPLLSQKIKLPFWDTDKYIEEITGFSIPILFKQGEPYFRRIESLLFKQLVAQEKGIIALGGGTPLQEENQKLLQGKGPVIWLDADPSILFQRLLLPQEKENRPLLQWIFSQGNQILQSEQEENYKHFLSFYEKRFPIYQKLASLRIDTSFLSPADVAEQIQQIVS